MTKPVGFKIRQLREMKGLSQDYVSNKLGISQRAYSKLERNETKIDWTRISTIAEILELDPLDLVTFEDSLVFNNCRQSGKFEQFNNHYPDKLIEQYEARIKELSSEVEFLRKKVP